MNKLESRHITTAGVRSVCCWLGPGLGVGGSQEGTQVPAPTQGRLSAQERGVALRSPSLAFVLGSGDVALLSSDAPTWHLLNLIENSERGRVTAGSSQEASSEAKGDMGLHPAT